jgi:dipeptidyl aminopeptidase/acylaminoacyl peptidase
VSNQSLRLWAFSIAFCAALLFTTTRCVAKQPFTLADEIQLSLFDYPNGEEGKMHFSPDGRYFTVWSERGRLDVNRVEDSIRFYRSADVAKFLAGSDKAQPPEPAWVVTRSHTEGPVINHLTWLPDSSGVAFLDMAGNRLVLADIHSKSVEPLTPENQSVGDFSIRDGQTYAYTTLDSVPREKMRSTLQASVAVTGLSLWALLFPNDPFFLQHAHGNALWAVIEGKRFEVNHDGAALLLDQSLALAPSGESLVTPLLVPDAPASWETLYPPPRPSDPYRIRSGQRSAHQYVRVDLKTGSVHFLTDAPLGRDAGWSMGPNARPGWSRDGRAILLPGTFIPVKAGGASRPCVAVIDLASNARTCVVSLTAETDQEHRFVAGARFIGGDHRRVLVIFESSVDGSVLSTEYRATGGGGWRMVGQGHDEPEGTRGRLSVEVRESFQQPPVLVASRGGVSRALWDPNPKLGEIEMGQVSIYKWKDREGKDWDAGLYKPNDYEPGRRYPLVIQTHGFPESQFRPSGIFTTAFAARALAAAGIMVLQVGEHCPQLTTGEGACAASRYESAAKQLVLDGLVDPEEVGIIGFSGTCFYVMEALTTSTFHFKAASITDGKLVSYMQYMSIVDLYENDPLREFDSIIGAKPFGEGLLQWFERSPGFNLDKVTAPLLVVGEGPENMLGMWEPYAGLRLLNKPAELVMLNVKPTQHILTNPAVRMASQGGSVDWFRFWLQDYEDPDPSKADQYKRWRELRKLQVGENVERAKTGKES